MSLNQALLARSVKAVWHPCTQMQHHEALPPLPIARGAGSWLFDFEGNRYLDAISSWWTNLFGHAHPRINAALKAQLDRLEHVLLAGCTHEPVVELSERLSSLAPEGLGHCFYASDGAAAVEIALKMSFHYWRNMGHPEKTGFISLANSYHGETLGALSVTDIALFKSTYSPILAHANIVSSPDFRTARDAETPREVATRAAAALEKYLASHAATTAAFIVEPLVQGAAGMAMHDAEYLRRAAQICEHYDVHLIADEIMTGFGRTGTLFACEQAELRPDFLCLSKGITGGYLPLSVVMTTESVYEAFYDPALTRGFLHSHSYTGNPLACRAALTVLDLFGDEHVLERNRQRSTQLSEWLAPIARHTKVRHFRSMGMIWAFEVDHRRPDFSRWFFAQALRRHLLLRPIGNTVYFMPPYIWGPEEMQWLTEKTYEIVELS